MWLRTIGMLQALKVSKDKRVQAHQAERLRNVSDVMVSMSCYQRLITHCPPVTIYAVHIQIKLFTCNWYSKDLITKNPILCMICFLRCFSSYYILMKSKTEIRWYTRHDLCRNSESPINRLIDEQKNWPSTTWREREPERIMIETKI